MSRKRGPSSILLTAFYVAIATLVCLVIALPAILSPLPAESAALIVPLAQLTPLLTALGFFFARRRGRLASVFALRWRRSWPAIGLGLGAVTLIGLAQFGVGLLTGFTMHSADAILVAAFIVPLVFAMQALFAVGEEFGWRGWLVTQLQERPFWQIAAASSLAWVIWHLPALPLIVGVAGWQTGAAYLSAIASWAPFMVALRLWSGSVWPAVFVHGALNSVRVFLTQSLASAEGVNWFVEVAGCLLWLLAAAALYRTIGLKRGQRLTRS